MASKQSETGMATKRKDRKSNAASLLDASKARGKATKRLESDRAWGPAGKDTRTSALGMATKQRLAE
eukprot:274055-Karenia_brevis.AAC.1